MVEQVPTVERFSRRGHPLIVLYDAACRLCCRAKRFVQRRDQQAKLQWMPLQSPPGERLQAACGLSHLTDSVIVLDRRHCLVRSAALLQIGRALWPRGRIWPLLEAVPVALRDALYMVVARHRLRWFGASRTCGCR